MELVEGKSFSAAHFLWSLTGYSWKHQIYQLLSVWRVKHSYYHQLHHYRLKLVDRPNCNVIAVVLRKTIYGPGGGYSLYSDDRDDRRIFRGCNRRFSIF